MKRMGGGSKAGRVGKTAELSDSSLSSSFSSTFTDILLLTLDPLQEIDVAHKLLV